MHPVLPRSIRRRGSRRSLAPRAFTLLELLVVITIIAILAGLLSSAIGDARRAAQRSSCVGHLKQLSLSLWNYEANLGSFPSGVSYGVFSDPPDIEHGRLGSVSFYRSGLASLWDYLEGRSGSALCDDNQPWYRQSAMFVSSAQQIFVCPSSTVPSNPYSSRYLDAFLARLSNGLPQPLTIGNSFGITDYLLCKGVSDAWCIAPGRVQPPGMPTGSLPGFLTTDRGMFDLSFPSQSPYPGASFACTTAMITDGLSNTIAMGEGAQGAPWQLCTRGSGVLNQPCTPLCWSGTGVPTPCSGWSSTSLPPSQFWVMSPNLSDAQTRGLYLASIFGCTLEPLNKNPVTHTVINTNRLAWLNCRPSLDWDGAGPALGGGAHRTSNFRSPHAGGGNFGFADGSVRWLSETIDLGTYRALSTIAGAEVVPQQ